CERVLGQEDVLVSMEAAPINPSDFLLVRGIYGVRPALPFPLGAEGVGRVTRTGSKVDVALQGPRVLSLPTYEQGTWADQVVVPVRNIVPMRGRRRPPATRHARDQPCYCLSLAPPGGAWPDRAPPRVVGAGGGACWGGGGRRGGVQRPFAFPIRNLASWPASSLNFWHYKCT